MLYDVYLPELDGPRLYRLMARRPPRGPRFIFLTGDRLEFASLRFLGIMEVPCLMQPCRIVDVRRIIERALGAAARSITGECYE